MTGRERLEFLVEQAARAAVEDYRAGTLDFEHNTRLFVDSFLDTEAQRLRVTRACRRLAAELDAIRKGELDATC